MPTYIAITPIVAFDGFTDNGGFKNVPPEQLKMLDGLEYTEEDFVEYMEEPLSSLVVSCSGIRLSLDADNGVLTAVSHFESNRELNEDEIAQLRSYYDGQMSDGIGENLLSEIQNRSDVGFRLEVFWLYDSKMRSQLRIVK